MEIVLVAGGLAFGPDTLEHRSLGGSETAALQLAKELRKLKHIVTVFCNLPPQGYPDHIQSGATSEDGVRWVQLDQFKPFISNTPVDLLIVQRDPTMFETIHQARKAVLWCHDLATYNGFLPQLMNTAWNYDEIWCVSQYHLEQFHTVTGYPKENMRVLRNGITRQEVLALPKTGKRMLYSARPERGLEYLVRPGGIMEQLQEIDPDITLEVTMYENYPEQMMGYYRWLWEHCERLPNVTMLGPKTQLELRQMMAQIPVYIYPTSFEEVSCILAREACEQGMTFLTNKHGALPETLGDCGMFVDDFKIDGEMPKPGSQEWIDWYVQIINRVFNGDLEGIALNVARLASQRTDLYWDEPAAQAAEWAKLPPPKPYSLIKSLVKNGDIVPAVALARSTPEIPAELLDDLEDKYPFLFDKISIEEYYKKVYELEEEKGVPERQQLRTLKGTNRYNSIAQWVNESKATHILEYGCAEGPIIMQLAVDFPDKQFTGIDFVESNIELCKKFAEENKITNVSFWHGSTDNLPISADRQFDALIIAEVLEHCVKPWEVMDALEPFVKPGGRAIITVPQGAWEWDGLKNLQQWNWRNHIWHIDKWMLRAMFADKKNPQMVSLTDGMSIDGRNKGHLCFQYDVDHEPVKPIDPIEKVANHHTRQSLGAAMIMMNDEETVLRSLNSIEPFIDALSVAIGPSTDKTLDLLMDWVGKRPWIDFFLKEVPAIKAGEFGFDDARNASIEPLESRTDWILWIDTDEYLSGNALLPLLRPNCYDSYAIHQHHFTVDPRGAPTQLDKPARLFRTGRGFKFFGKVHEHAEKGFNGGPGFVQVLPNVDIGHTGYVNEDVRRTRFARNFPLLEWDQEVYPERRLGRYLWLRDIIHRIRLQAAAGNVPEARKLAEEAIAFYREHGESFAGVGEGSVAGNSALAYYSEAMTFLNRGHPINVQVQFDGATASYSGVFENETEALELASKALQDEIRKRTSGYWQ